ncbi:D-alanyl-D-alanine carboxypeptidase/D-alanyl-D-alanine-endopeptidase [Larkinella sp. C7]|uniref:D-alanyl-D-alanine carboxypeptidase/D-alanyl-D-alanine-endopeptidase n=1 Tax=Larkinella sp. C7 TaxID=2576607 RepID=UPI001111163A|nr:D-alanyl-D-alanine carboxypeptidase [Larkinella sp. C7]
MRFPVYLLCLWLVLTGCSTYRPIQRQLRQNPQLTDHATGFALYDWEKQKMVVQHQAHLYFTPASNTKLFSFYAGLVTLGDSIPALRYITRSDSLIFWGTGDPSLLNQNLPDTTVLRFLRNRSERLVFSTANYSGQRFGPGWAWDDFNDDYSAELAPLPLYGNFVRFGSPDRIARLDVEPRFFRDSVSAVSGRKFSRSVQRDEHRNRFDRPAAVRPFHQDIPFRWSPQLAAQLLADTLHRDVATASIPFDRSAKTLYSQPADSLYKRMLQVSDNTLAEHLMLLCSSVQDTVNLSVGIQTVLKKHLADLPDKPNWVDGSGLSRYNLFTPRSIIALLQKIYKTVPQERLFQLLAIGGSTGTIQRVYKTDRPFVFAKSGSMTGVYNLSGYLITKKGKLLLFSMMHNNFAGSVADMRNRTAAFLTEIHQNY